MAKASVGEYAFSFRISAGSGSGVVPPMLKPALTRYSNFLKDWADTPADTQQCDRQADDVFFIHRHSWVVGLVCRFLFADHFYVVHE